MTRQEKIDACVEWWRKQYTTMSDDQLDTHYSFTHDDTVECASSIQPITAPTQEAKSGKCSCDMSTIMTVGCKCGGK